VSIGNLYEPAGFAEKTAELAQKISDHHAHLLISGHLALRMERKALMEISDALKACILEPVLNQLMASGELKNIAQRVKNREADPYSEAEAIARRFLKSGEML
jgi:LAO/AO transport system kinase